VDTLVSIALLDNPQPPKDSETTIKHEYLQFSVYAGIEKTTKRMLYLSNILLPSTKQLHSRMSDGESKQ